MQPVGNTKEIQNNIEKTDPPVTAKKDEDIKFCEPVFKPKKHDFL